MQRPERHNNTFSVGMGLASIRPRSRAMGNRMDARPIPTEEVRSEQSGRTAELQQFGATAVVRVWGRGHLGLHDVGKDVVVHCRDHRTNRRTCLLYTSDAADE